MRKKVKIKLPYDAWYAGYTCICEETRTLYNAYNNVYLKDNNDVVVYAWEYVPNLTELREVCEKVIAERG